MENKGTKTYLQQLVNNLGTINPETKEFKPNQGIVTGTIFDALHEFPELMDWPVISAIKRYLIEHDDSSVF